MSINESFQWTCHPQAEEILLGYLEEAAKTNPAIQKLREDLLKRTSTRLFDWIDHIEIQDTPKAAEELEGVGFIVDDLVPTYRVFHHPGAQLPRIVLSRSPSAKVGIFVMVDSIANFLMVRGLAGHIEGVALSGYRRCCINLTEDAALWVVERRGTLTMEPTYPVPGHEEKYLFAEEKWKTRPRSLPNEDQAMSGSMSIAEEIVSMLGADMAAWVILSVEREYWQSRNTAAQIQKNRQDALGMGWANHDHHTFRCSRDRFQDLVHFFEMLGFHCRERFYAGAEAGWGAQVMENPRCRLILFLDVDLAPHEVEVDFAHNPLPERKDFGTIGLWCALHGNSILASGMHHLEAQFMFDELTSDLHTLGVGMMDPFSSFPYLRQAFTKGEVWQVAPERIDKLLEQKKITAEQAEKFRVHGVIGSHLENLQRREGYKGFNQKNVSVIIKKTDPRTLTSADQGIW